MENVTAYIQELVKEDFAGFDETTPGLEQAKRNAEYKYSQYFKMLKELGMLD